MKLMHYDKSTGAVMGFYSQDIHGINIPAGCVPVSDDVWGKFLTDQQFIVNTSKVYTSEVVNFSDIFVTKPAPVRSLIEAQTAKIQEMNRICGQKIRDEFYSSCLGTPLRFDCEITDQLNIQGLCSKAQLILNGAVTDTSLFWKSAGEVVCYPWQPQQVLKLGTDLFDHISSYRLKYEKTKQHIQTLSNIKDVDAVTWNTVG